MSEIIKRTNGVMGQQVLQIPSGWRPELEPFRPTTRETQDSSIRSLMSQLGYLSLHDLHQVIQCGRFLSSMFDVPPTSQVHVLRSDEPRFLQSLRNLDAVSGREYHCVGMSFEGSTVLPLSPFFCHFFENIGWSWSEERQKEQTKSAGSFQLHEHIQNTGIVEPTPLRLPLPAFIDEENERGYRVYSDSTVEIQFYYLPTLAPLIKGGVTPWRHRMTGTMRVLIVWNEGTSDYTPPSGLHPCKLSAPLSNSDQYVYIVIRPLDGALFHIQVTNFHVDRAGPSDICSDYLQSCSSCFRAFEKWRSRHG